MGKNIFATITHVAERIIEAIAGHKNDNNAHPVLTNQINVLSDKVDVRGYEFSQIKNNGYDKPYRTLLLLNATQLQELGLPDIGYGWWWFEFLPDAMTGSNFGSQRAKNFHTGDVFEKRSNGGWNQIATTSKTDILCTPRTGYTIVEQNCYQINNVVYIDVKVKRTDDSVIPNYQQGLIAIPSGKFNTNKELTGYLGFSLGQGSIVGMGGNGAIWNDGLVYASVDNPNIYVLQLKTSYILR